MAIATWNVRRRAATRWARGWQRELLSGQVFDRAAALTYYGVLSLIPGLAVAVAVLGLFGAAGSILEQLGEFTPGVARSVVESILQDVRTSDTGTSTLLLVTGLSLALWSASGYVAAFARAGRAIRAGAEPARGWHALAVRVGVTLALFVLLFVITLMVVVSGPVARQLIALVGIDESFASLWSLVKWPVILAAMTILVTLLHSAAGTVGPRPVRLLTWGGFVTVTLWVLASAVFSFYVSRFSSYSRVYGSLAGVVVFLVWMWLANLALLVGVMAQAKRDRRAATVVR